MFKQWKNLSTIIIKINNLLNSDRTSCKSAAYLDACKSRLEESTSADRDLRKVNVGRLSSAEPGRLGRWLQEVGVRIFGEEIEWRGMKRPGVLVKCAGRGVTGSSVKI